MLFRKFKKTIENILIVEDEPLVAFDNELRIADAGYSVAATVDNQEEAIEILQNRSIELVLADVMLAQGGNGVEVAKVAYDLGVPVLFVSGGCPVEARQYAIGCLVKPYNARDLVRAVQAVDLLIRGQQPRVMPRPLSLYRSGN